LITAYFTKTQAIESQLVIKLSFDMQSDIPQNVYK